MVRMTSKQAGFSLVELMIAVAIMTIMAAFVIPGYFAKEPFRRLNAASQDLFANLQLAKVEAIKSNANVVVGFYTEGEPLPALPLTPVPLPSPGTFGSYMVFDDNGSGGGTAGDNIWNGTEPVLVPPVAVAGDIPLRTVTFTTRSTTGFDPQGLPLEVITISLGTSTIVTDTRATRTITVSVSGGIKMSE